MEIAEDAMTGPDDRCRLALHEVTERVAVAAKHGINESALIALVALTGGGGSGSLDEGLRVVTGRSEPDATVRPASIMREVGPNHRIPLVHATRLSGRRRS